MNSRLPVHALPPPPAQHVLVVCAANVCRSPSMEFFLRQHLQEAAPHTRWVVNSVGTVARPGDRMCSRSAAYVKRWAGGDDFVSRHHAAALTAGTLDRAGLVLVASDAERAAVAELRPEARRRTFTLRQAALLIERVSDEHGREVPLDGGSPTLLETVVELLHDQRGTLAISTGSAHLSSRRARGRAPLTDIPDVHQGSGGRHKTTLNIIRSATLTLADNVALLGAQSSTRSSPRPATAKVSGAVEPRGGVA